MVGQPTANVIKQKKQYSTIFQAKTIKVRTILGPRNNIYSSIISIEHMCIIISRLKIFEEITVSIMKFFICITIIYYLPTNEPYQFFRNIVLIKFVIIMKEVDKYI